MVSRFFILGSLCFFVLGCQARGSRVIGERLDHVLYRFVGKTLFSRPTLVTVKEIHLDKGLLLGQMVEISGQVVEVGEFGTYAILADDTARMLVVLTDIDSEPETVELIEESLNSASQYRILGSIDYGKRGLPYLMARGLYHPSAF